MSDVKDGGPAFPGIAGSEAGIDAYNTRLDTFGGMSLRDHFAGQALSAYADGWHKSNADELAQLCYAVADAMLQARKVSHA